MAFMLVAMMGTLVVLAHQIQLNAISRETAIAMNAAQAKMEEIRLAAKTDFAGVYASYNGQDFNVPGLRPEPSDSDGKPGDVTMNNTDPDLIVTTITVQWKGERRRTLTYETLLGSKGN